MNDQEATRLVYAIHVDLRKEMFHRAVKAQRRGGTLAAWYYLLIWAEIGS